MAAGKAGRPLGSKESPNSLLKNELKATAQTLAKGRAFIEKQIAMCDELLKRKETTLEERLKATEIITDVMEKLGKVLDSAAKNLAPTKAGGSQANDEPEDVEKIIESLKNS